MTATIATCKKTYISVPPTLTFTRSDLVRRALWGSVLSPMYWLLAHRYKLPGLWFAVDSTLMGVRSLLHKDDAVSYGEIYRMLFWPVESTRYFEFGLAWSFLSDFPTSRYLDVSSPRLFPITVLANKKDATADFINPDVRDLQLTAALMKACGLEDRCHLTAHILEKAPLEPATFDLITSISVVEHISHDSEAILRMWELLKPNGRMVVSVPCAAMAEEQFIDTDHFGLQKPEEHGFFFLQYIYDEALLHERFYRMIGRPTRFAIYGEREPGSLRNGLLKKWSGRKYPKWKEPYLMAREFQRYQSLEELPGEGVMVMQFDKT
jgi:SAM-dependent methyltransferase